MLLRRFIAAALALSATFCPAGAQAQSRAAQVIEPPLARAWLQRLHQAAEQRNYRGTQAFSSGGNVSSARVVHYSDGAQQYESVEMLDGQMRRVFRHNDQVYTLWPQRKVAVVEQRTPLASFPSLLQADGNELFDHYELSSLGLDRQAEHDVEVFLLRPRDAFRFAHRLWAELQSGLLLRADVLDPRGDVLESAAFLEISIGVKPQPDAVLAPIRKLDGYRVIRPQIVSTQLKQEGWSLKQRVPGFRQVSCVKRLLPSPEAAAKGVAAEVLQAIFADGLTHVSLFVEPFDAARHVKPMATVTGATHTLMQRHGEWWITAVGDVPITTLKQFVAALSRRKP